MRKLRKCTQVKVGDFCPSFFGKQTFLMRDTKMKKGLGFCQATSQARRVNTADLDLVPATAR